MRVPSPQSSAFQMHRKYLNVSEWGRAAGGTPRSPWPSPIVHLQLCINYLYTSPPEACWPRRGGDASIQCFFSKFPPSKNNKNNRNKQATEFSRFCSTAA